MASKPSETLRAPYLTWDTETFLTLATSAVLQSKDPVKALSEDPPVVAIHYRKKQDTPEHEFVVNDLHNVAYALERTVSLNPPEPDDHTVNQFLNHPTSQKILDAILETVEGIPSSVLAGGVAVAVGAAIAAPGPVSISAAVSAVVPLSLKSASSSHLPLVNEGPNISSSYLPRFSPVSMTPKYSLREQTTMTMAEVFQAMSDSRSGRLVAESLNKPTIPPDAHADDRFLGEDKFNSYGYNTAINLLTFYPKRLTRVHVALLAHVIHQQHPLYSLFRRQCYWFASTFVFCAKVIDHRLQELEGEVDLDNRESDDMFVPFHLYAKVAGCWRGIRIHGIKLVLVNSTIQKFDEEYAKLLAEVEVKRKELAELDRNMLLLQHYQAQQEAASGSGPSRLIRRNV